MKIGVVCEGRTDFPALEKFLGNELRKAGVEVSFKALYPQMDQTRPGGGWANVLIWLRNNPPAVRVRKFFQGGLFGGELTADIYDAILLHLDSDVVEDGSFRVFVSSNYGLDDLIVGEPSERGATIKAVIRAAAKLEELAEVDRSRHVIAVAVEATETWCLAAFHAQPADWEALKGADLTNAFMKALEISESREPQDIYVNCDKDYQRRSRFCKIYEPHSGRVSEGCMHFQSAVQELHELSAP